MHPESLDIPNRKRKLALDDIGSDKKWAKLFQKPDALQSLFFQVVDDETNQLQAGAALQREVEGRLPEVSSRRETLHISFWWKNSNRFPVPSRAGLYESSGSQFCFRTSWGGAFSGVLTVADVPRTQSNASATTTAITNTGMSGETPLRFPSP